MSRFMSRLFETKAMFLWAEFICQKPVVNYLEHVKHKTWKITKHFEKLVSAINQLLIQAKYHAFTNKADAYQVWFTVTLLYLNMQATTIRIYSIQLSKMCWRC